MSNSPRFLVTKVKVDDKPVMKKNSKQIHLYIEITVKNLQV